MLKFYFFLFITIFSLFFTSSDSICCQGTQIRFSSRRKHCHYYGAETDYYNPTNDSKIIEDTRKCHMLMCKDGRPVEGYFCGNGPCNWFGCQCQDGCRQGSGIVNFKKKYGFAVYDVVDSE